MQHARRAYNWHYWLLHSKHLLFPQQGDYHRLVLLLRALQRNQFWTTALCGGTADPCWAHSYHQLSPHRSSSKELSQHAQGQNYKLIPREMIFRLLTLLSFHTHASEWMRSSSSLGELPPSQAQVSTAATFGNTLTRFTWVLVIFFFLFFLLQLKMKLLFTAIDHL